jgi:lipid-binding SYLF domain-containing protein
MRFLHKFGIFVCASILLVGCATPKGNTVQDKRSYVLNMKNETLSKLYREYPETRSKIKNAAGHAVFSSINTNLFLFSSGNGYGVAVENSNGKKTYMKMNFIGVGPGIGLKDFRAVFIFRNKHVFNDFVEKGWEFGGQADAAAKSGEKGMAVGGEMYVKQDIEIYHMTEAGVALQATIAGTKYRKDSGLN